MSWVGTATQPLGAENRTDFLTPSTFLSAHNQLSTSKAHYTQKLLVAKAT